jgi:uncharacterized BrkB/YihY/UPF0761 family membrane protein
MAETATGRGRAGAEARFARDDDPDRGVEAGPFDKVAYLFEMVGLYLMVGGLFFYGFWEKAVENDFDIAPQLEEQFDRTFIATVPGADVAWVIITVLEGLVFLLLLASIVTMEFRPSKRKPFLLTSLSLALLVFGLLALGQNATAQHESVASLYGYFGSTIILMLFVRMLPPYTSNRWLG